MCNTVVQKPLAGMPAYVKIPVIAGYWFIMMFGLGYCNVAFNLLSFQRFHRVRKLLITCSANTAVYPRSTPLETLRGLSTTRRRRLRKRHLRSDCFVWFALCDSLCVIALYDSLCVIRFVWLLCVIALCDSLCDSLCVIRFVWLLCVIALCDSLCAIRFVWFALCDSLCVIRFVWLLCVIRFVWFALCDLLCVIALCDSHCFFAVVVAVAVVVA